VPVARFEVPYERLHDTAPFDARVPENVEHHGVVSEQFGKDFGRERLHHALLDHVFGSGGRDGKNRGTVHPSTTIARAIYSTAMPAPFPRAVQRAQPADRAP